MAKIIAFSGNSSTGKTSLSFFTTYYLKSKGYDVGYLKDDMRSSHIDLDKIGCVEGEKYLLFRRIKREYQNLLREDIDFLVTDLSLLDPLAYILFWGDKEGKNVQKVKRMALEEARKYHLVFYLKTEGAEFDDDGYRLKQLRKNVEPYYKKIMNEFNKKFGKLREIGGENLEKRKKEVAEVLAEL